MTTSLVEKTLSGLKKRLVDNQLTVQNENGHVEEMEFQFKEAATDEEIEGFIQSTGLQLPEDYQAFLRIHNGSILFQPWYGGQFELYGVSEIVKNQVPGLHPESWYPIGYQDGGYLLLDGQKIKKGEPDYLIWWESSLIEDAKPLDLNFELWFDRFVTAQGAKFWDWPLYNVHRYYKNR
ncbi:SMI1/KNR4 family protein [Paludifilum halophilum]|uniref:Knr4/Smi1-like domain-containing protein n=1 Tax=Paludifilum halophilum TaxID=1642702 RepID=A0A235B8J4_9BACL|nr:SMI1/KNR4 family protein [Paludifilum halophilum]OYD08187.1 hypothetical protein CHM34_08815 [Paludifilum halophilum]